MTSFYWAVALSQLPFLFHSNFKLRIAICDGKDYNIKKLKRRGICMKIFRKRYIPNETIDISKDEVVYQDENLIVTKWLPIKPRTDIARGESYAMLDKGWKISKFYDHKNKLLYWYCDIIEHVWKNGDLTLVDLLVDVIVHENGVYEIVDLDELDDALKIGLITPEQKYNALLKLEALKKIIEEKNFPPEELKRFE